MKIFLILILISFIECYITSFKIIIKKNMINCVSNFMNLNTILNNNDYANLLRIYKYNNDKSICFKYKTFSNFEEYNYNNLYLIKNKFTYLTKYNFNIFNEEYKYLFLIKAYYINNNKTLWHFYIKYNNLFINDKINNDKIIYDYLNRCLNKKNEKTNKLLTNFFNY